MGSTYQYDAFISYRHTPLDKAVAEKLHRLLESYVAPKKAALAKRKLTRVFRDREELPTSSDLASNIQMALENSEFLIVICSPDTPKSKWVAKEIETFIALHGHDRVLALLVAGEPSESFPSALITRSIQKMDEEGNNYTVEEDVEPLAADIRAATDKARYKKLNEEIIRMMAALLGCRYDELRQRHKERKMKRIIGVGTAIGIGVLGFGSISTWQAIRLKRQVDETLKLQSKYLSDVALDLVSYGDRVLGAYIALEALPQNTTKRDRPYVEEAEYALNEALYAYKLDDRFVGDQVLSAMSQVSYMSLSDTGKYTLTQDAGGMVSLWDTASGKMFWQRSIGEGTYNQSGFLIGEERALIQEGNVVKSIGLDTEEVSWEVAFQGDYLNMVLSKDQSHVVVYDGSMLSVLSVIDGARVFEIPIETPIMSAMAISPDNENMAFVTDEGVLSLINLQTQQKKEITLAEAMVTELDFNSSSDKVVCARNKISESNALDEVGEVAVYTLEGEPILKKSIGQWGYDRVRFSPDDPELLTLISDGYIEILSVTTGDVVNNYVVGADIKDLIWRENMLVVGCADGTVRFYLIGHSTEVEANRISSNDPIEHIAIGKGTVAISSKSSPDIKLYKQVVDDGFKVVGKTNLTEGEAVSGKLSHSGKWGVFYDQTSGLEVWDMTTQQMKEKIAIGTDEDKLTYVDFAGEQLILLTETGLLRTVSLDTMAIKEIQLDRNDVANISLTQDYSKLLIEGYFGFMVIDPITLEVSATQKGEEIFEDLAMNDRGIVGGVSENGAVLYENGSKTVLTPNKFEHIILGKDVVGLWDTHLLAVYEGTDLIKEIPWVGKKIENILIAPNSQDVMVVSNDNKLYIISHQTGELVETVDLKTIGLGGFTSCLFVEKDNSLLLEGQWYTLKLSANHYKPVWCSNTILDVSNSGTSVLVRDDRYGEEDKMVIYPYYGTKEAFRKGKALLQNRVVDETKKKEYYVR